MIKTTKQSYKVQQELGQGGQGVVFLAIAESTREVVAVKLSELPTEEKVIAFVDEILLVQHLKRSKVKNACEVFEMDLHYSATATGGITVMKKYDCDLFTHAFDSRALLTEAATQLIFRQVCQGIQTFHRAGVAHMDLKPENLLIDYKTQKVSICDFGSCIWLKNRWRINNMVSHYGARGTKEYFAPELIVSSIHYDPFKIDSFCLGVVLFVMLTGQYPYSNDSHQCEYDADVLQFSPMLDNLIRGLLHPDPKKRFSVSKALAHPWLRSKNVFTFKDIYTRVCTKKMRNRAI
jgi:serine/threonine protein kinase